MKPARKKQEKEIEKTEKDDRTVFEKQEDAWFENDCQGSIEEQEI